MTDALARIAAGQGGVVSLSQASDCGYSDDEVGRFCARGLWTALRRSIYLPGVAPSAEEEPIRRHVVDTAAALLALGPDAVASHSSGAALFGLDWIEEKPKLPEVWLARPVPGKARHYPGLRVVPSTLPEHHVVTLPSGLRTCAAARVVVDLARKLPVRDAVVFGDSAMRLRVATLGEIQQVQADCTGWPGTRRAARALALLDPRSESAAESLARLVMIDLGFTGIESQFEILDSYGEVLARVDFLLSRRVVVEVDGKRKYVAPSVVWEEKLREDVIRERYEVVRLSWADIHNPPRVQQKIMRAFERSTSRFPDRPDLPHSPQPCLTRGRGRVNRGAGE